MASIKEDALLSELSEQIDVTLHQWIQEYNIAPLNLTAVILARLSWLAKMNNYENDFLTLLECPKDFIHIDENTNKNMIH
jgi:hypothetical protein